MSYTVTQAERATGLKRSEIIKIFQQLHRAGVGIYKTGRRGWPTRIEPK